MPTALLAGTAAAGAIAFINSVGNLGGHFGPALMGKLKDQTGNYYTGLYVLSGALVGACILALLAKHSPEDELAARRNNVVVDPLGEEVVLTDTPGSGAVAAR
jgi:ACS family tartrate transporter-like MFS transporter